MNSPKEPNAKRPDEDMVELFAQDNVSIPPSLDQRILATAHEAVKDQALPINPPSNYWRPSWSQGLSAAAVVVLGVLLVPMMMSSPESSLGVSEADIASAEQSAPTVSNAASAEKKMNVSEMAESPAIVMEELEVTDTAANVVTGDLALRSVAQSESQADDDSVEETAGLERELAPASVPAPADASADAVSTNGFTASAKAIKPPEYRANATLWIQEILRLHEEKEIDEARDEYVLFNLIYPNHDLAIKIPDEVRN